MHFFEEYSHMLYIHVHTILLGVKHNVAVHRQEV